MGPLVTAVHRDKVAGYVELGVQEGAKLFVDSQQTLPKGNGFFLAPCLFDGVTSEMRIYREEIFGPVLSVMRVPHFQQALDLVAPPAAQALLWPGGNARREEITQSVARLHDRFGAELVWRVSVKVGHPGDVPEERLVWSSG